MLLFYWTLSIYFRCLSSSSCSSSRSSTSFIHCYLKYCYFYNDYSIKFTNNSIWLYFISWIGHFQLKRTFKSRKLFDVLTVHEKETPRGCAIQIKTPSKSVQEKFNKEEFKDISSNVAKFASIIRYVQKKDRQNVAFHKARKKSD